MRRGAWRVGRGCLGFRALATDGGTFDGGDSRFWVDLVSAGAVAIYCSRQTSDPILWRPFLPRQAEDVIPGTATGCAS